MGAEFDFQALKASTKEDAIDEVDKIIEKCLYDYGHAGYTGTLAETSGTEVVVPDSQIKDEQDAYDWIDSHSEKWGPALIIRDTSGNYYVGAWCSS